MEADEAATDDDALGEAGTFDAACEAQVFNDLHSERFEASDFEIGGAAEKIKGADAERVSGGFGVGDAPGAGCPEAEDLKEAEDGGFIPALDEHGGKGDEMVGTGSDGAGEGEADGCGVEDDVGVGEEQIVGWGLAGGEGHGVGLAEPTDGEFSDVEGAESVGVLHGDGVDDCAGGVGGAVVDGDDLEVGIILGEE